jgi:hypothetical protein
MITHTQYCKGDIELDGRKNDIIITIIINLQRILDYLIEDNKSLKYKLNVLYQD